MADTSGTIDQQPVLLRFTAALDAALDRLGDPDPAFLSTSERRRALLELAREEERITALRVRVQGAADDVAEDVGARDAGVVLASWTRRDRRRVAAEQRLADALQRRSAATGVAWREGRLNGEQAAVIAAALDRLPATVAPELLGRAEEHLVDQGGHHDPHGLRVLGSRIWEVIAPDEAEEQLRRAVEAQERNARAATKLNLHRMGDGSTRLCGRIPDGVATRLATLLEAFTSPRRDHLSGSVRDPGTGERLPAERLRGQAFCTLVEHADPDRLPRHGQAATSVLVTIDLDRLRADLDAGALLDGTPLSPGEVRRLACSSEIIPLVLGGDGEILDQGRASRLFTTPQRKAMAVRDRQCRAAGCSVPAPWCEAHHLHPWSQGGRTDLADGLLLCSFHHHRIHDPAYDHQHAPDGGVTFHRRT
ncbi:MAG TPA: DUF222 domain-containing protein [Marmoricola sp.]|nr:DUF222 domain-containing protein [Marmoricola sp.]